MKKLKLFICLTTLCTIHIFAQEKWNINYDGDIKIYTPKDLKSNKTFDVYTYGPIETINEDLKTWVSETAKHKQKELGEPLKKWVVKSEKKDYAITNSYVDGNGVTMQVAYQGGKLDDGRNFFIRLITSTDLVIVLKYGARFDDLVKDIKADMLTKKTTKVATKSLASNQTATTPTVTTSVETSGEALSPGDAPKGFLELRGVLKRGFSNGMLSTTSGVIALFKDGTYTSDIGRTFSKGIAASKSEKPNRWGQWRMRNNDLEIKAHGKTEYKDARDWLTEPATKNLKLNNCYGNITSRSTEGYGGGSTVGNASSWCFKNNGRFAHSKTGFANANGGVRGSTSSSNKTGGRYYLSNYVARFVYDDGTEVTTSFCFLNEKKTHIAINGKRLTGK
ncbi:hypothetical protein PXD56_03950 [Maribacter sp. SA7]|uniref:hypothetical protein n=1 Tax=Maribacter zhoushanensis TaxID=3030012 RepID=UPI0023ED1689|nr:hypothetical protein [Maribacter zhoushanensis]MDF4202090.1 hypothetical protein [Maribacter zhoushanensis]